MKKFIGIIAMIFIVAFGCAKLQVAGSKEPIKLDISMRLDVYQHVAKDIDAIENIVSGKQDKKLDKTSFLSNFFIGNAFAQETLSPEVEQAALRRKDRLVALTQYLISSVVGENKSGLVEIRQKTDEALTKFVENENADRMLIYKAISAKNSTPLEEVARLYAKKLQENAPGGSFIEVIDANGSFVWKKK